MRVHSISLVAVAATVVCLDRPSGISGLTIKNDDHAGPNPTRDNPDTVVATTGVTPSDAMDESKTMFNSAWIERVSAVVSGSPLSALWKLLTSGGKSIAEHERELLRLPTHLFDPSPKLTEALVKHWYAENRDIDKLCESLKLSSATRDPTALFRAGDYRKIEVLRSYIEHVNKRKGSNHELIKTLRKNLSDSSLSTFLLDSIRFGVPDNAAYAAKLQQEMMASWEKDGLSADNLFATLGMEKKGKEVFGSMELSTLERYVEYLQVENLLLHDAYVQLRDGTVLRQDEYQLLQGGYMRRQGKTVLHRNEYTLQGVYVQLRDGIVLSQDDFMLFRDQLVLNALINGFKSEQKVAMLAGARNGHHPEAGEYLKALLRRWKIRDIAPERLFAAKHFATDPSGDARTMEDFIFDAYRNFYLTDESLSEVLQDLIRSRVLS
ncbi:unnamed protein product [Hyaloperonospora brassicae]|uniref:RxLR effector candidate protein n=1 Tax=Hyaloperonospora brassicae TaxID=162125 RepID=A0AAV0TGC0_HYABA|nr:unnamed protein product [Hyaloperonospora brassicae]